jgi:glycosidase
MQWDPSLPNAGFSAAPAERLYLPQDPAPDRPAVTAQHPDPASTLNRVRRLLQLRRSTPQLRTAATTTILARGYPLAYLRGDRHLVVVNPAGTARTADISSLAGCTARPLETSGTAVSAGRVETGAFGYGVFALEPAAGQSTAVTLPPETESRK